MNRLRRRLATGTAIAGAAILRLPDLEGNPDGTSD